MHTIRRGTAYSLIPARAGSKGVPDKNIKLLNGRPLIAYSVRISALTPEISRTIVSTDSEEYAAIARDYGAEAPFLRPASFSGDSSTDSDVLRHFLDWLQEHEGAIPEYVVHLRPTTPLRSAALVGEAVRKIRDVPAATALRSAHEMSETAYKCLEIQDGRFKAVGADSFDMDIANLPRQMFPVTYSPNGYVDVLKSELFLATGKIHGEHVVPFLTPVTREVDTPDDFDRIEADLAAGRSTADALFDNADG